MDIYSTKLYLNFSLRSQKGAGEVSQWLETLQRICVLFSETTWWLTPPLTSVQGDQMLFSDFHMRHAHSIHTHSHTNRQITHKYEIKINIKKKGTKTGNGAIGLYSMWKVEAGG